MKLPLHSLWPLPQVEANSSPRTRPVAHTGVAHTGVEPMGKLL